MSTFQRCEELGWHDDRDWSQRTRAGAPAYFEIEIDGAATHHLRVDRWIDILFWSGAIGFAFAAVRRA